MTDPEKTRHGQWPWYRRGLVAVAGCFVIAGVLWYTPTQFYVVAPGAAYDTSRMVTVSGGNKVRAGKFMMLAVTSRPANLFWYLFARIDSRAKLETSREFLGPHRDYDDYLRAAREMMDDSQATAKVLAEQAVGYPARIEAQGAEIVSVRQGGPVDGLLFPGDVIVTVGEVAISTAGELVDALARESPGRPVAATVRRGDRELRLSLPTVDHPDRPGRAALLVSIKNARAKFFLPVPVEISSGEITGPSAGLMFALEVMDQLSQEDLSRGLVIAGTGTVEPNGRVGPIGGIVQKTYTAEAAGAQLLLVPKENYEAAAGVATRVKVVAVDSLKEALDYLKHRRGEESRSGEAAAPVVILGP